MTILTAYPRGRNGKSLIVLMSFPMMRSMTLVRRNAVNIDFTLTAMHRGNTWFQINEHKLRTRSPEKALVACLNVLMASAHFRWFIQDKDTKLDEATVEILNSRKREFLAHCQELAQGLLHEQITIQVETDTGRTMKTLVQAARFMI